jgi:exo-beta-1,3-glucanase (GH17 family)
MAAETDVRPTATNQWVSWTDAMYQAVPDLNNYFDAVAVHPYSGNLAPDATSGAPIHERFDRIGLIHDRMVAKGASNKPFWITEVGWSTCSDSSACVNEATQADYTARLFHVVSSTYRSFVAALFLYRSSDLGPSGSSDREANFGLAHEDGSPKPAWASVRAAAGA